MASKKKRSKKAAPRDVKLEGWLKNKLRRISYQWPELTKAVQAARISRGLYKCAKCGGPFKRGEINRDHIVPVDNPETGFTGWDDYVNRLFCKSEGIQILCLTCHGAKTFQENMVRKQIRNKKYRNDL